MRPVAVRILVPPATAPRGTPGGWLEAARAAVAERHRLEFLDVGATDVVVVSDPAADRPFGERLRELAADAIRVGGVRQTGLIVLGGGSMPLARRDDYEAFLAAARMQSEAALANSYYSADAIALPDARMVADVPDLPSDNALPRWLAERAGIPVRDLRDRRRLAMDVDSPLDVLLLARDRACPPELRVLAREIEAAHPAVAKAMTAVGAVMTDRRAELVVAGRTSASILRWLERNAACRVRALVEERGLRASSALALGDEDSYSPPSNSAPTARQRPPRSVLGQILDARGPDQLGDVLADLGDAAILDSRVLLAHRLGADETGWPAATDRFASDLLASDRVDDPWLRALTAAAATAPIPILLGGHSLVGPGLPLLRPNT